MRSSALLIIVAALGLASVAAAQQAPAQSNLEAGGLRPPDAVQDAPPPEAAAADTPEKELAKADKEDSGRGLEWVWLNAEIGTQHLGLETFKAHQLVDPKLVSTTQTGLVYGAGAGVRILVFTAGARFRVGSFSEWQIWTLDLEGGLRIPFGRVEPYFNVAGGYASLGAFSATSPASSKASAKGFDARLGFGIDVYLSNTFSVGGNLSGDVLFLSRSAVAGAADSTSGDEAKVYAKDGSSIGAGGTLTAVLGLHF
jgi:hypothetical protein